MSTSWALRSLGEPYFAVSQQDMAWMDGQSILDGGIVRIDFEFKLNRLPTQYASKNECHAIFSHVQYSGGVNLFEFGITPAGAFRLNIMDGAFTAYTVDGWIQADQRWHSMYVIFDYDLSAAYFYLDDEPLGVTVSGTPAYPVPGATSVSQFILFNSATGLARSDIALRSVSAKLTGISGGEDTVTWALNERAGSLIAGTVTHAMFNAAVNPTLTGEFRAPVYHAFPWGAVPDSGLEEAYRWEFSTEYTEIPTGGTIYSEVGPA